MEDIENRLRESTATYIASFENWMKENKNLESREALMESMHELRKVMARIEIEIAISERDRLGSRPLPIPPHRSSRKNAEGAEMGDDAGNFNDDGGDDSNAGNSDTPRRQNAGGGGAGRGRRPMHNRDRGERPERNNGGNNERHNS
jgi:hypothetical protein